MATMAADTARITSLLEQLNKNAERLQGGDNRARDSVVAACLSLISEVETPADTLVRLLWGELSALMALRTAIDLKLFHHLSTEPKGSFELSEPTSAEPALILRVLRVLSAAGVIRTLGGDSFCSTAFSTAMAQPDFEKATFFILDTNLQNLSNTPAYLRERGWANPTNPVESCLAVSNPSATGDKEVAFQIWPRIGAGDGLFSNLRAWSMDRVFWADEQKGFYPFTQRILKDAAEDKALLIDVGGGSGADARNLLRLYPSLNRLVLQETPSVIEGLQNADTPPQIQLMSHDFFTPQPVLGARAYFFHSVIHDWPVNLAKQILRNTAAAMVKAYSKLIIWDVVLPDTDCPLSIAGLDWCIMNFLSAGERTESDWKALIESDDVQPRLKVTGFWFYSRTYQTVIEAELA